MKTNGLIPTYTNERRKEDQRREEEKESKVSKRKES